MVREHLRKLRRNEKKEQARRRQQEQAAKLHVELDRYFANLFERVAPDVKTIIAAAFVEIAKQPAQRGRNLR